MNMYGHILYIIYMLVSSRLLRTATPVSFFGFCFLKLRNALGNKKIAKLVFFIFKCMRSSS